MIVRGTTDFLHCERFLDVGIYRQGWLEMAKFGGTCVILRSDK
jgi:hypothetical protein